MKKLIALLLAMVMVLGLAACAASESTTTKTESETSPATTESTQEAAESTEAEKEETTDAPAAEGEYAAFDAFPHPKVKPEGGLKIGVVAENLTSESIYRWDWQMQVECAHRGWEYVSFQYQTNDNYEATFQSALNQDVDALVLLNSASAAQWADLYDQAREQGVGVYTLDQGYGGYVCGATSPGAVMMSELLYRVGSDYNWDLDCAIIANIPSQTSRERLAPLWGMFEHEALPNMTLVAEEDVSAIYQSLGGVVMAGLEIGKTWMEKYGDQIQCIFSYGDNGAMGACEAVMASGDLTGEKTFCVGIDGGRQCWSYIRNGEPMKYSYAQGFELQMHSIAEIIEQIQVQGLNPGDEGCDCKTPQSMLFFKGGIVTKENVPDVGTSIHQAFDYYDESVTDPEIAWWTWDDGPGVYMVEAYESN